MIESKRQKRRNYLNEYTRRIRGRKEKGKIQCKICGSWYWQLGSHVVQRHDITARDYRIKFGFDYKTGKETTAKHLRELYKKQALENGTYKNLRKGICFRFIKGDERAGRYKRSKQTMERLRLPH